MLPRTTQLPAGLQQVFRHDLLLYLSYSAMSESWLTLMRFPIELETWDNKNTRDIVFFGASSQSYVWHRSCITRSSCTRVPFEMIIYAQHKMNDKLYTRFCLNVTPKMCQSPNKMYPQAPNMYTWRLLCGSFLVMTCFLLGGYNRLPNKE